MRRLARTAAVLAVAATPFALSAPASAACYTVPVGRASAWYCDEPRYTCAGVDTLSADAGACLTSEGVECYVALPDRPLLACA